MRGAVTLFLLVKKMQVGAGDQPRGDRVFDQSDTPVCRQGPGPASHAGNTHPIELVSDVVEFSVETGDRPPQPGRRLNVTRNVGGPRPGLRQPGFAQRQNQQVL